MKRAYSQTKIGVLGGGQLARMLVQRGHELGLEMHVLSASPKDPAAQVTPHWHKSDMKTLSSLSALKGLDFISFESEFLDATLLREAAKKWDLKIAPTPRLMGALQDRWTQKILLQNHGLPTSPFVRVDSLADLLSCTMTFKKGFVLKKRMFGYDGYGTFVVTNKSQFERAREEVSANGAGYIAEEFQRFSRELAISAARNKRGEIAFLPLVESKQVDSRCYWVKGPIIHRGIGAMKTKIRKYLDNIKYNGIMAFELFDVKSKLLVNEIAPRVHNSAHYSMNALSEDQFSLHLKAILNAPLHTPRPLESGFAMVNLLGKSNKPPQWTLPKEAWVHWYGKTDNRPGRKMGHLNATGKSPNAALKKVLKFEKEFRL